MLSVPRQSINRGRNKIMPRIVGVNIPDNKKIKIALTYIYGIGLTSAESILTQSKINADIKAGDLNPEELNRIKELIEKNYKAEGDLRRELMLNVKRLKDIKCYRGTRHIKGLPVRGQRTKTNSRTRRGNVRKTAGSGKRAVDKK